QIGLAAGPLGNEVDDVERARRELPRQAAEQRDKLDLRVRHRRQMAHDGGQCAPMTDAHDLARVALQNGMKIARPGESQRLDGKPGLAEVGSDLHGLELEACLEDFLELYAF